MKKIAVTFLWLIICTVTIGMNLGAISIYSKKYPLAIQAEHSEQVLSATTEQNIASPSGFETSFQAEDARPAIVANFLKRHGSPLEPYDYYGKVFVEIADRYQIDFRLVPAIAMQESNLCKVIPPGSNNCLGFGVHSRGTLTFEKYEDGFERAARELKKNYIDIGLTTPEQIMTKYTPSSNGSWAASVNQWMAEMRFDDRSKGRTEKTDADLLEFIE